MHPLHVESVAWVAERKDVLAGLFFMLALLAYERYARAAGAARASWRCAALLALGLMAKPMLVTLPLVLLLLDFWPLGRWLAPARRAARRRAPLAGEDAAARAGGRRRRRDRCSPSSRRGGRGRAGRSLRRCGVANALVSYAGYLGKTFWPAGLRLLPATRSPAFPAAQIAVAALRSSPP